jgi:4-hydroxy-2-oxoheptanedioate aldolase
MEMPVNQFKRALRQGRVQIGLWSSLASHYSAEVIAGAGFDWLLLDTEHSPNDVTLVLPQLQAAAPYPTSCVVRPAWNDMVLIKRYLDIGAQSLLIPFVQNADDAQRAVAAMRYPPQGVRGVTGGARHNRFGRVKDYFQRVHDELCLLVQIETRAGLKNLEAIAAVDGVDGLFIGPADLSADFGKVGTTNTPQVMAAIEDAVKRIRACGKAAGILSGVEAEARHWLELGVTFIAVGSDLNILARGSEALAAKYRG